MVESLSRQCLEQPQTEGVLKSVTFLAYRYDAYDDDEKVKSNDAHS